MIRTPYLARVILFAALSVTAVTCGVKVLAHGNVTPQPVDVSTLPKLTAEVLKINPYRGNPAAIKIGESAYGQNCARCHGLEAISGGIAPDLRHLDAGEAGDEWFIGRYEHGAVRDGKVYMPAFGPLLGQEAGWAIRAWLDTKHEDL
jgi:cytochrome c-550 PedF